jgi:hypothetical protein
VRGDACSLTSLCRVHNIVSLHVGFHSQLLLTVSLDVANMRTVQFKYLHFQHMTGKQNLSNIDRTLPTFATAVFTWSSTT